MDTVRVVRAMRDNPERQWELGDTRLIVKFCEHSVP